MEHNLSLLINSNFRGKSLNYQVYLFVKLSGLGEQPKGELFLWLKKILEQEIGR